MNAFRGLVTTETIFFESSLRRIKRGQTTGQCSGFALEELYHGFPHGESLGLICLALLGRGSVCCKQIDKGGMSMQDFMRNLKLLGIGLFYTGKEKIEETIAELIKKGEISEPEGKALVDELVAKSKAATKDLEERIRKVMSDVHDKLHAPMKKEIDVLKKRVEKLDKAGAGKGVKRPKKISRSPRKTRT
jgi:polyhydroxyalkanoate synthesis regulator phasin